jgi:hypothetical protein
MKTSQRFWKWLGGRLRRRTIAPRWASGLHVERLEPRTVLSASIGALPANYDAPPVFVARDEVVRDGGWNSSQMVSEYVGWHFEDGRVAFEGRNKGWMPDLPNRGPMFGSFRPTFQMAYVIFIFKPDAGPTGNFDNPDPPPAIYGHDGASPDSQPQKALASFDDTRRGDQFLPPPMRFAAPSSIASLALTTTPTTHAQSTGSATITAHDSAFQSYSTDDLLLALDLDDESDDEDGSDLEVQSVEDETEHLAVSAEIAGSLLDDHAEVAVDSLARERAEIDTVLSELQDVESDSSAQSTQDELNAETPAATAGLYTGAVSVPLEPEQATIDPTAAGMVWLVPTGDANSSAWDLSGVFLGELPAVVRGSAEVEATLGIYQAFDVGTPEPMPATADAAPASTPAADARPNVSAGNQTAKQSDQPS